MFLLVFKGCTSFYDVTKQIRFLIAKRTITVNNSQVSFIKFIILGAVDN